MKKRKISALSCIRAAALLGAACGGGNGGESTGGSQSSNPELAGNFVKGCFQWQERCAGKQVAECHRKMLTGMVGCVGAMVLEGQADESLEGQQTER